MKQPNIKQLSIIFKVHKKNTYLVKETFTNNLYLYFETQIMLNSYKRSKSWNNRHSALIISSRNAFAPL